MAKLTFGWGMFRQLFDWSDPDDVQIKAVYLKNASDAVVTVDAAVTAHAGGGQGSATAITKDYTNISTCATAGDSVKLPTAAVGLTHTITNRGAASADVFPYTGDTINGGSANAAIKLPVGATYQFIAINSTDWKTNEVTLSAGDGTESLPSITFSNDSDTGIYSPGNNIIGFTINGTKTFDVRTSQVSTSAAANFLTNNILEVTSNNGVTIDGLNVKDGGITANSMVAGFFPTAAGQELSGAGAINVTSYYTAWTTTSADAGTMAVGTQIGQRKKIKLVVDGGDGTLTPTSLSGGTTITFNDAGDYVEMIWNGTNWFVIENFGCLIA